MSLKKFLIPAVAALAMVAGTASSSDAAQVIHKRVVHTTVVHRANGSTVVRRNVTNRTIVRGGSTTVRIGVGGGRVFLPRERAVVFFRARPGIRYVGEPYVYGNYYVQRCYDPATGALAYCEIDPYSGAWLGVKLRL